MYSPLAKRGQYTCCPSVFDLFPSLRRHPPRSNLFFYAFSVEGHDACYLESAQEKPIAPCSASVGSMNTWSFICKKHNLSRTKRGGGKRYAKLHLYFGSCRVSQQMSLCTQSLVSRMLNQFYLPQARAEHVSPSCLWFRSGQNPHSIQFVRNLQVEKGELPLGMSKV